jgi:lipopolysaccharide transport system permease protein
MAERAPAVAITEIGPARRLAPVLGELWAHRELLYFLALRDVKLRYKETALGIVWAVLQPLLGMVIFTVVFGRLARLPSDGVPYAVWSYTALVLWTYAVNTVLQSANSVIGNAALVTKVYFPRLVVPLAASVSGLLDFGIALLTLFALMAWHGVVPGAAILAAPIFALMAIAAAAGLGVWLAALNVRYRDVRYAIPFLTQAWLFATPVVYSARTFPETWRPLVGVNPMAGAIEGFRWALLGTPADARMIAVSAVVACAMLAGGIAYFRAVEGDLADLV